MNRKVEVDRHPIIFSPVQMRVDGVWNFQTRKSGVEIEAT